MTNIFYDTEFIDDGRTIDLISIGMIDDTGRELYAVNRNIDLDKLAAQPWHMEHTVPTLPLTVIRSSHMRATDPHPVEVSYLLWRTDADVMPRVLIAEMVRSFIETATEPQLWAWYGAYDHVALAQLFGPMVRLPRSIPMYTNDIKTLYILHGNPRFPDTLAGNHNALIDARAARMRYEWITKPPGLT